MHPVVKDGIIRRKHHYEQLQELSGTLTRTENMWKIQLPNDHGRDVESLIFVYTYARHKNHG